jgi:hypothetical protein
LFNKRFRTINIECYSRDSAGRELVAPDTGKIPVRPLLLLLPAWRQILVNGKRRHQSALVNLFGSRGRGNTRNNSPLTRKLGIPALTQEKALNASLGLTGSFSNFTATVDGYYVLIKDRIVLTGLFQDTDPDIGPDLQTLHVGAAQLFTNAVDTRTLGLDVILTYSHSFALQNLLSVSYAANFNQMKLENMTTSPRLAGKENIYFGLREQKFLLAGSLWDPVQMGFNGAYYYARLRFNF